MVLFHHGVIDRRRGIFLIVWNASVWGTIFGLTAKSAAVFADKHPIYFFGLIMLIVFPHMIIEGIAYFLAAISGSVISKDVILEQFASDRFWKFLALIYICCFLPYCFCFWEHL